MHIALNIAEIQCIIVECIGNGDFESMRSLACLARTSKAFENVALKCLWSRQCSLVPLFRTLGDAIIEGPNHGKAAKPQPASKLDLKRTRAIVCSDL